VQRSSQSRTRVWALSRTFIGLEYSQFELIKIELKKQITIFCYFSELIYLIPVMDLFRKSLPLPHLDCPSQPNYCSEDTMARAHNHRLGHWLGYPVPGPPECYYHRLRGSIEFHTSSHMWILLSTYLIIMTRKHFIWLKHVNILLLKCFLRGQPLFLTELGTQPSRTVNFFEEEASYGLYDHKKMQNTKDTNILPYFEGPNVKMSTPNNLPHGIKTRDQNVLVIYMFKLIGGHIHQE
jgi:hypothetical protein